MKRQRGSVYDDSDSDDDSWVTVSMDAMMKCMKKAAPADTSGPIIYKNLAALNDPTLQLAIRCHMNWAAADNKGLDAMNKTVFLCDRWSAMLLQAAAVMAQRKIQIRKKIVMKEAELRSRLRQLSDNGIEEAANWSEQIACMYNTLFNNLY